MKPVSRIAILSQPGTGEDAAIELAKSLCALGTSRGYLDCSAYMDLGWSECSAAIAKKLAKREEYIVVGVQVARVLRKMLKARPGKRPCDVLIVSSSCEVTKPHERLQKANETVLSGIYRQLERLRVRVIYL